VKLITCFYHCRNDKGETAFHCAAVNDLDCGEVMELLIDTLLEFDKSKLDIDEALQIHSNAGVSG